MHELPKQQLQAVVTAIKTDVGEDCLVACNANGIFSSAPRLASEVELIFDSGIELMFLGEQAIARNSGRKELEKNAVPIVRPINMNPEIPGKGSLLAKIGSERIWMVSLADQNMKTSLGIPHEALDNFFSNKDDTFPVFISVNGNNIDYKKALAWRYSNSGCSVAIIGTGLNIKCGEPIIDEHGSLFVADIGAVASGKSICGISPESWWKKNIERVPTPLVSDNSQIIADYSVFFYEKRLIKRVSRRSIEV